MSHAAKTVTTQWVTQITIQHFFQSPNVHIDIIKVLLPTDEQDNCLKVVLKCTLKQFQQVSV